MRVFQDPGVVITVFVLCSVFLAAVGIYFAVRGIKAAEGRAEKAFVPIGKLESNFEKAASKYDNRSVMYINISADQMRDEQMKQKILKDLKQILLNCFCADEDVAICAYSENSFVALAKWSQESAKVKIESCCNEFNKCLLEHSALNVVDVRIGAYYATGAQVIFDDAINRAKQACVLAKQGKLPYAQWDAGSGKDLEQRIKMENNIEKQIDGNRFFLEYQPVIDVKTRKIIGAEVLSRLNSETEGILSPRSFLTAVDSAGLHGKFDYYIFEKNCKWISNDKKQREGYQYTINFSRSTLCEPAFVEKVIGIAQKYDLNLSCLAVEILEDKDLSGDAKKRMIENLSALKEKGMGVLLDDFGSGFTTFGDLQSLDISIVKIDRAITQNAVTETGFIILKNIINTSKDIGFKTLCEGIETKEHEEAAIKAGCDLLQGYYYYKPMPVAMLENLLKQKEEN